MLKINRKRYRVIPGRDTNLFFSLFYLSTLVLIPLAFLIFSIHTVSFAEIYREITTRRVLNAFKISFVTSFLAALINLVLGVIIAWVLVKYKFYGRRFLDSIIDLPFAMPTAVSGISLAILYSDNGWMGSLINNFGIQVSYTSIGIVLALVFIGIPFVVRAVQPAIQSLDLQMEEAAASLGASKCTILRKIIFPQILPSMITGFTMSFARGLGEYGSVIFIAGNIPYLTEIVPLLIVIELEEFNYQGATVLAVAMLFASFALLLILGFAGSKIRKWYCSCH